MEIVLKLTDLLFPPRPSERIVREASRQNHSVPYRVSESGTHCHLTPFTNPLVHALVIENKFYRSPAAGKLLAKVLSTWLATQTNECVLIPIPLSRKRLKTRGYNQVREILKYLPTHEHCELATTVLIRTIDTKPQTELNRSDRLRNMQGVFSVPDPAQLDHYAGRQFVLIDDVVTTGATLSSARAALAPHLPPESTITTLAIAH